MRTWIGCSGFSYKAWSPSFYPKGLKEAGYLKHYATQLRSVELNNSFYRLPTAAAVQRWTEQVSVNFRFAVKAPQRITHQLRLKDAAVASTEFQQVLLGFGATLGPALFQLPPNLKKDTERLARFLDQWPSNLRAAFEFRHESWLDEAVFDVLRAHNVALCSADGEQVATPLLATADFGYTRLRAETYSPAELEAWAARIAALGWVDAHVYFKHEVTAPEYSARLEQAFEQGRQV